MAPTELPDDNARHGVLDDDANCTRLVILSVNDTHDPFPDQHGRGGFAGLSTLLQEEKKRLPPDAYVLVTVNGDFLSGSEIGERFNGTHAIECLNAIGVDYVVLGNHEFDFNDDKLKERIRESKFKWLGSNVIEKDTQKLLPGVLDTEVVVLPNGLRMGIFGVCTEDTPKMAYPSDNIVFQDIFATAQRCVAELQAHHVDFILALTHVTIAQDRLLARKVPGIDLMLGGHDHEPYTMFEGKTMIHKSGQNSQWLARIELQLTKEPDNTLTVVPQWRMIANQSIQQDVQCQRILHQYTKRLQAEADGEDMQEVLAITTLPLSTKTSQLRKSECNMGNLAADAMRAELKSDFAVINGGFIRGNNLYEANTSLTKGLISQEMPFPRPAVLVRIRAGDVRDAILQHLSKYPQPSGSYPHLSGIRAKVDMTSNPPRVTSFQDEQGHDIDENRFVLVATTYFISRGGDGCDAWKRGEVLEVHGRVAFVVCDYLRKQKRISYPAREGRLVLIDE